MIIKKFNEILIKKIKDVVFIGEVIMREGRGCRQRSQEIIGRKVKFRVIDYKNFYFQRLSM